MPADDARAQASSKDGLEVLAQFTDTGVVLGLTDVERLTVASSLTARRCLDSLTEMGFLVALPDGRYRLGDDRAGIHVRRGKRGSADATA